MTRVFSRFPFLVAKMVMMTMMAPTRWTSTRMDGGGGGWTLRDLDGKRWQRNGRGDVATAGTPSCERVAVPHVTGINYVRYAGRPLPTRWDIHRRRREGWERECVGYHTLSRFLSGRSMPPGGFLPMLPTSRGRSSEDGLLHFSVKCCFFLQLRLYGG